MKSAAYVQFLSNLCICERSTVYLHPSESIESTGGKLSVVSNSGLPLRLS